jgi:trimethylamine--corrinoid protein Co-methyltransferase
MERYRTAFYQPLVADLSNFGNWTESGSKTASERANTVWKRTLDHYRPIARADEIAAALDPFIARHTASGGAEILS